MYNTGGPYHISALPVRVVICMFAYVGTYVQGFKGKLRNLILASCSLVLEDARKWHPLPLKV